VQVWIGRPARMTQPVNGVEKIKFVVTLLLQTLLLQTVVITMETQKLAVLMAVPTTERQIHVVKKVRTSYINSI